MDPNVFHFSHPHPLERTTPPSKNVTCFGCKLKVSHCEDYYRCKTCAFSLHRVCYKMPLITNHPSHPTHDLVLLVIPSSPSIKATLNCVACGHHVTGFSYHCAECSIFFHSVCLALPVSLEITYHPHQIKLEFTPPYDFFCDLCNKPSYNGWLYRCSMCEFDTHIACAVANLEPQLFQSPCFSLSSPLLRQLTSTQRVEHTRVSGSVGDSVKEYDYSIMCLVAQQIGGGIRDGTDNRLYSSTRQKNNRNNTGGGKMKIIQLELQGRELSPAELVSKIEERTPLRDKETPLSDHSATPSNQYSDSYFSIDLAKSYSIQGRRSQLQREGGSDKITTRDVTTPKERVGSNYGQREDPCNDSYDAAQTNKVIKEGRTSDFVKSTSQRVMTKNPNEDQTIAKPQPVRKRFSLEEVPNLLPLAQARGRHMIFGVHNMES
ncbi:hypothetical protein Fmac_029834 [Flemingia macrophylla]|uniref:DC1 domain-containing protein n=1 Tax=Flemingia macrophylla TaxID=520843 RepID=A0ABD1LBF8_9FABA